MSMNRDPSPEQIAQRCAEIQAGWSERERLSRLRADLRPSFIRADGIRQDMDSETYNGHHNAREKLQETAHNAGHS